jgi:uncharacterized protein YukE
MDATSIVQHASDFVLRQFPSMDDMIGLTGLDPFDGHVYKGLGFNPVGANPKARSGLEDRTAQQARTLADVASLIKLLGDPDPSTWEGDGAKAFIDRVKALPPEYEDAAAALRALGPLVTEARQAITAGKTQARNLDDQAWQAKQRIIHEVAEAAKPKSLLDKVVTAVVPVAAIIGVALDPEVSKAVHALVDILEQGDRRAPHRRQPVHRAARRLHAAAGQHGMTVPARRPPALRSSGPGGPAMLTAEAAS